MKTFFVGDTHFNHKNIIKYCDRPFEDTEEMNEVLIENWNRVVGEEDLVIHIGDIGFFKNKEHLLETLNKLNGRKWLIIGNHDPYSIKEYYEMGFEFVSDKPVIFKDFFILSHRPIFMTEQMPYVNVYGHVHDNPMYKDRTENTWCVCVERINYTPVEFIIDEFNINLESEEKARQERKAAYKNDSFGLGRYFGKLAGLILSDGRLFVQLIDDYDSTLVFREEYSSTITDIHEIVTALRNVLSDNQHPFTKKIRDKLF